MAIPKDATVQMEVHWHYADSFHSPLLHIQYRNQDQATKNIFGLAFSLSPYQGALDGVALGVKLFQGEV